MEMRMLISYVSLGAVFMLFASIPPAQGAGDQTMPAAGSVAPDFSLNNQEGKPVSLHDFQGKWVVLYFYPKDFTSGCTLEAQNFQRDRLPGLLLRVRRSTEMRRKRARPCRQPSLSHRPFLQLFFLQCFSA